MEYLLAQGADVDGKDKGGMTALHYAACRGDQDYVRFLLDSGADVNSRNDLLGTPVCVAALMGHAETVDTLLKCAASLRICRGVLGSAIHFACFGGNISIVRSMLERGESLDLLRTIPITALSKPPDDLFHPLDTKRMNDHFESLHIRCSPILLAAHRGHYDLLTTLWSHSPEEASQSISSRGFYSPNDTWEIVDPANAGVRPVFEASSGSSFEIIQSRAGISSASKTSASSGWSFMGFAPRAPSPPSSTLLMWAASTLNPELIQYLLKAGAIADQNDNLGRNALHYAASPFANATLSESNECVQRLIQGGVTLYRSDDHGRTPLMLTVCPEHPASDPRVSWVGGSMLYACFVASFLGSKIRVNDKDYNGRTALMHAVSSTNCRSDIVELLCNHGAATESVDKSYCTALHISLENRAPEQVISILLNHGADPNLMTGMPYGGGRYRGDAKRPLDLAILNQASEGIIRLLLSHGADPKLENGMGTTPTVLAKRLHRRDIIELFETIEAERKRFSLPTSTRTTSSDRPWFNLLLFTTE